VIHAAAVIRRLPRRAVAAIVADAKGLAASGFARRVHDRAGIERDRIEDVVDEEERRIRHQTGTSPVVG
jgi:hypothetical protein